MEYHRKKSARNAVLMLSSAKELNVVPRIGIARVVNAILVVVKSLIRLPLLSSIYMGAIHYLKQLKNMVFLFLPYNDISKTYPKVRMFLTEFTPLL